MTTEGRKFFFQLTRAAVWQRGVDVECIVPELWPEVLCAFEAHAMTGLVADAIMSIPEDKRPSEQLCGKIRGYMGSLVREHYRHNTVISELFPMLEKAGVKPVLLKGQGIGMLYPMTNTRSVGDIDIYVGMEKYTEAMHVIQDYCGMPRMAVEPEKDNIHGTVIVEKPLWLKGVKLEVHYKAADTAVDSINDDYNDWAADKLLKGPFRKVAIAGTVVKTPGGEWGVVSVFEHLLKHLRYEGAGFRQFVDWMLCLANTPCNPALLKEYLERFYLMDAWQVLGGVLVWQLGYDKDKFPFWNERKARCSQGRNLDYIMNSGNLGEGTAKAKGYYYMRPSLKRRLLAMRYYARLAMFEYRVFPHDTLQKYIRRLLRF